VPRSVRAVVREGLVDESCGRSELCPVWAVPGVGWADEAVRAAVGWAAVGECCAGLCHDRPDSSSARAFAGSYRRAGSVETSSQRVAVLVNSPVKVVV